VDRVLQPVRDQLAMDDHFVEIEKLAYPSKMKSAKNQGNDTPTIKDIISMLGNSSISTEVPFEGTGGHVV
jgi:hypothetical protein